MPHRDPTTLSNPDLKRELTDLLAHPDPDPVTNAATAAVLREIARRRRAGTWHQGHNPAPHPGPAAHAS